MRIIRLQFAVRLMSLLILPVVWLYPAVPALAETVQPTPETSTEQPVDTSAANPGPTKPQGPDAKSYKYNEVTGLWENDYYTWDPASNQTAPKGERDYSYNPETDMWDTTDWKYDAPSGEYVPNTVSTSQAPTTAARSSTQSEEETDPANKVKTESASDAAFNLFYDAKISNNISSTATSGEAMVAQNTLAGDALSGNAQAMANIINMLQSSWGTGGSSQVATFINNIDGDVFGDLVIDPGQIPTSTLSTNQSSDDSDVDINVASNAQINNQINLAANSGNATVKSNTQAGNATSGDAVAIANVVNMINSTIASGQSFVGMININGNFNGDILMPAELISQLLGSNSVPKTTINTNELGNGDLLANFNNNQSISNIINASANSGNASVLNNTTAGNATTGNASTNITLLNLTSQQIIGSNALLVFINVQGQWLGMIVNAPAGSTSAALGSGIRQQSTSGGGDTNINTNLTQQINNDITLAAVSGNAQVTDNTLAGNATSGDATASVNMANILNSSFSLSNWFGVLFINITGNWVGSFGIDTSAGESASPTSTTGRSVSNNIQVFKFVAHDNGPAAVLPIYPGNGGTPESSQNDNKVVLASATPNREVLPISSSFIDSKPSNKSWILPSAAVVLATILYGAERIINLRNKSL